MRHEIYLAEKVLLNRHGKSMRDALGKIVSPELLLFSILKTPSFCLIAVFKASIAVAKIN